MKSIVTPALHSREYGRHFHIIRVKTIQQCMWSLTCFLLIMGKRVGYCKWNEAELVGLANDQLCLPLVLWVSSSESKSVWCGSVRKHGWLSSQTIKLTTPFSTPCPRLTLWIRQFLTIEKRSMCDFVRTEGEKCYEIRQVDTWGFWRMHLFHGFVTSKGRVDI